MHRLSLNRSSLQQKHPVVIVGGNVVGLGLARSLASSQTTVIVVDTSPLNAALWSRYCSGRVIGSMTGEGLIAELEAIGRAFSQRPILILTQDASVEAVSTWRARLEPYYRLLLPSERAIEILSDKALFHSYALSEGLPVPSGIVVASASNIAELDRVRGPVVVKPARKAELSGAALDRATRFDNINEAKAHCAAILKLNGQAIVQEWVEGSDCEIYFCLFFCDEAGRPLRIFTGRKLSAFPPQVGSTAICIAAPDMRTQLEALTERLTTRIQFSGIGGLEFKRDVKTGAFVIIEPTVGRTDWQEEIATLSGINIPQAAVLYASNQTIGQTAYNDAGIAWRTSLRHRLPGDLHGAGRRIVDGYWRVSDPMPGLIFYCVEPIRRAFNLVVERLFTNVEPRTRGLSGKTPLRS